MNKFFQRSSFLPIIALTCLIAAADLGFTGCKTSPTQQKTVVNSLFTIHKTADVALNDYLDLVIKGTVSTNSLPQVLRAYNTFQGAYNIAVSFVSTDTNVTAVPQSVTDALAALTSTLTAAKKGN